jgi:hypothetical protein
MRSGRPNRRMEPPDPEGPPTGLRLMAAALCVPPALVGLLFGLRLLQPSIMRSWCTARRGCGGTKVWELYPGEFPAIALGFGIAFACLAVLLVRAPLPAESRLANLIQRMTGLGAFFGLAVPLYWIAGLSLTNGHLGRLAFYAPLALLVIVVGPVEAARIRAGKLFDES